MSNSEPVAFDPYHFPNLTAKSVLRDISFMIFGAAIYEAVMCLSLYFTVCNKAKFKSGIFQLITIAVFPLTISLLLSIISALHLNQEDAPMSPAVYTVDWVQSVLTIISKYGYYIAATLRTRALLALFPKIMYGFYILLATSIINNLAFLGIIIYEITLLVHATPETILQILPQIIHLQITAFNSSTVTTIFDMVLANALTVSFLCPIFNALEMSIIPAIRTMIQLGDVQKALISSLSSIVVVILAQTGPYSTASHSAISMFWLHTQNSLFLRLTYFSTCELLSKNSTLRVPVQNIYSTDKPKSSGSLRRETRSILGTSNAD